MKKFQMYSIIVIFHRARLVNVREIYVTNSRYSADASKRTRKKPATSQSEVLFRKKNINKIVRRRTGFFVCQEC